jgi:tetratricopeptide (TPR) repeat protein
VIQPDQRSGWITDPVGVKRNRMFLKRKKTGGDDLLPVPAELPPIEELDERDRAAARRGPRAWLWTLVAALAVVLLVAYVLVLGALGVYDGLKDRAVENQRIAREHYELGIEYLEAGDYELAIAEFTLALRYDSNLYDAQTLLQDAEEMAKAQVTPTSETRQDAANLLYRQAVAHYESGNLEQAVAVLEELRGLDADHQRENVELMLTTAHYQLGLNAVGENHLDEATEHFEAVLAIDPDDTRAQDQLNLVHLYTAALNHWERDWSATIQALKGLYALAPDYKDVQTRLHDAYVYSAQDYADSGDWCQASDQYAAAVQVLPLEGTVDKRDEAAIRCLATAEAPPPTSTPRPTARVTLGPTAQPGATISPDVTPSPTARTAALGQGRIAFASFDAVRQAHDIYVVDLAQGGAKLLWENASQPAFAPGGRQLAFHNLDPVHLGLGILDLRTNELRDLTDHLEDSTPDWSPDAEQIVFASDKHGDRKWRIYVISPGAVRGEGEEWIFGRMPDWSPDGDRIAYHGCDARGDNCSVWVMLAGGFEPSRLTTSLSDTAPAWSPSGNQIAFISSRAGNWELYLVDLSTGQETRLTDNAAADVAPTWSPDGKRLAFLSNRDGGWAVYILEIRSGQVQKVIATGDAYPDPVAERLSWVP